MKDWFMSREPRERAVLGAGACAAAIIVFWGLIWLPVSRGSARLQDSVAHKSSLLVDLERASAIAPAANSAAPRPAAESMVVLVDRTSRSHGLAGMLMRTRPDGTDGIAVTFQDAPFDALLGWLAALRTAYGVKVESASVNGAEGQGLVSGQVLLRRP
ncbi:MAG TPA: type II secretion system protein GspM [Gammaproteobacteria bacterium]|nr:type II secretion system protein GspM [Gammaproteobacteria bacterium]